MAEQDGGGRGLDAALKRELEAEYALVRKTSVKAWVAAAAVVAGLAGYGVIELAKSMASEVLEGTAANEATAHIESLKQQAEDSAAATAGAAKEAAARLAAMPAFAWGVVKPNGARHQPGSGNWSSKRTAEGVYVVTLTKPIHPNHVILLSASKDGASKSDNTFRARDNVFSVDQQGPTKFTVLSYDTGQSDKGSRQDASFCFAILSMRPSE